MESAYIFKNNGEYLGSFSNGEDLSKNFLIKLHLVPELSILSHQRDLVMNEKIDQKDTRYFWAAVEELRKREFQVFVFDGERREIAGILALSTLENSEKMEFFTSLLSVASTELSGLKKGIKSDLAEM